MLRLFLTLNNYWSFSHISPSDVHVIIFLLLFNLLIVIDFSSPFTSYLTVIIAFLNESSSVSVLNSTL